jgi:phosphoribosyl-AMP cyclohydrolase
VKISELNFDENGLVPVAVQEADTGEVLLIGFANQEAIEQTFDKGLATLWSRSQQKLWTKGETSGNLLRVVEVRYNCEESTLLYLVRLEGDAACHTGNRTCFYRVLDANGDA